MHGLYSFIKYANGVEEARKEASESLELFCDALFWNEFFSAIFGRNLDICFDEEEMILPFYRKVIKFAMKDLCIPLQLIHVGKMILSIKSNTKSIIKKEDFLLLFQNGYMSNTERFSLSFSQIRKYFNLYCGIGTYFDIQGIDLDFYLNLFFDFVDVNKKYMWTKDKCFRRIKRDYFFDYFEKKYAPTLYVIFRAIAVYIFDKIEDLSENIKNKEK